MSETNSLIEEISKYRAERAGDSPLRLEHFGFKVYSQSDEDGIIHEIFNRIGAHTRIFVEFGAGGDENNTHYLLETGWTGLWIEANKSQAEYICAQYADWIKAGRLKFSSEMVTVGNINDLIHNAGISGGIDLLSVDIDGNDYHVFNAINVVQPRVLVLEHNHHFAPDEEWVMPHNPDHLWDGDAHYGASLLSFSKLAALKGYTLVGCGLYSPNGFYVRNDCLSDRFSAPFSASRFFNPLIYEKIVSFPVVEFAAIKKKFADAQSDSRMADMECRLLKTTQKLQDCRQKAAKLREKCYQLRKQLSEADQQRGGFFRRMIRRIRKS